MGLIGFANPALCDEGQGEQDATHIKRVKEAIRKGTQWLVAAQQVQGHYGASEARSSFGRPGPDYHNRPGYTAFALFTLLKSEVPTTHRVMTRGFNYLREQRLAGVYENAMVIMAMRELYYRRAVERSGSRTASAKVGIREAGEQGRADFKVVRRSARFLVKWQINKRGWRYGGLDLGSASQGKFDVSATFIALSGLKAASACDVPVAKAVFRGAASYLTAEQSARGRAAVAPRPSSSTKGAWWPIESDRARGFPYMKHSDVQQEQRATGSMTAAGVAGLMICKSELKSTVSWRNDGAKIDKGINDGLAWLHNNWVTGLKENPSGRLRGTGFYWWAFQRVATMGGLSVFHSRNWWAEGSSHIVSIQERQGFWGKVWRGRHQHTAEHGKVLNTCYALLFLRKHAHPLGIPSLARGGK